MLVWGRRGLQWPNPRLQQLFLFLPAQPWHCSGTVGEVVPHLSFQLRYETQGLLSCSGTDVEGEVLFLWHMLCETFPSFFFKSQFWFQYPKKRQQCCQSYLLTSEIIIIIKKTKYFGKCLILCRLEWMRLLGNNTVFWNIWRNSWVFLSTCDGTSLFNSATSSVEPQPLSAEAWVNSHLCEVGMEMFLILIYTGREPHPSFLPFLPLPLTLIFLIAWSKIIDFQPSYWKYLSSTVVSSIIWFNEFFWVF